MGSIFDAISGGFGAIANTIANGAVELVKFGVKTNPEATVKVIKDTEETVQPVVEPIKETVETVKEAGETVTKTIGGAWDGITGAIDTVKKYALPAVAIGAVGYILLNRR